LKVPSSFCLLADGIIKRINGGINLEKYLPAFQSWVLFSWRNPSIYCLLIHCQNLNQKGIKLTMIKYLGLKLAAIQESLLQLLFSPSATSQPKSTIMEPMSFKDCPIEVMTSAKKKSLNLTVPKGAMTIYKMV